jgi:hypothetical protein
MDLWCKWQGFDFVFEKFAIRFLSGLTPELTGAGGPIGPQGTNIGHQNREAMANVGVRVERFVRHARYKEEE